jgi:hypothetical protein
MHAQGLRLSYIYRGTSPPRYFASSLTNKVSSSCRLHISFITLDFRINTWSPFHSKEGSEREGREGGKKKEKKLGEVGWID